MIIRTIETYFLYHDHDQTEFFNLEYIRSLVNLNNRKTNGDGYGVGELYRTPRFYINNPDETTGDGQGTGYEL